MVAIVYILLMGHITHVNLVPVRRVMMDIMALQQGAQLKQMIATSVQFQRIEHRPVLQQVLMCAQTSYRRGSPQRVTTEQFLDARFHVFMVVLMVHIAMTMGSLFGTARVPMRGN